MAIIKTRGTAKAKPSTSTKPARRSTAKETTSTKRTASINRSPKTDLSQAQLNKVLTPLSKAAKSRNRNHDAWKEDVATVNELIVTGLSEEIPVNMTSLPCCTTTWNRRQSARYQLYPQVHCHRI